MAASVTWSDCSISSHEPATVVASVSNIFSDLWKKNKISAEEEGGKAEQNGALDWRLIGSYQICKILFFSCPVKVLSCTEKKNPFTVSVCTKDIKSISQGFQYAFIHWNIFNFCVWKGRNLKNPQTTDSVGVYEINSDISMSNHIIFQCEFEHIDGKVKRETVTEEFEEKIYDIFLFINPFSKCGIRSHFNICFLCVHCKGLWAGVLSYYCCRDP